MLNGSPNQTSNLQTKENNMKLSRKQIIFTLLTIIFLLAACAPAQVPTPDPEQVAELVSTSVALTVASQNLDTAEAEPPPATETPLPTATEAVVDTPTAVPALDTPTAIALPSATAVSGSSTGGGTTANQEFSCDIIRRRPSDNTVYKPNDRFDIKWTIINDGTKTLRAGLDLRFSNGDKLMADTIVELPELKPGDQFQVSFDAVAPAREGTYVMVYMVEGALCYPYTSIKVEK
jgi:hypothetical protein